MKMSQVINLSTISVQVLGMFVQEIGSEGGSDEGVGNFVRVSVCGAQTSLCSDLWLFSFARECVRDRSSWFRYVTIPTFCESIALRKAGSY